MKKKIFTSQMILPPPESKTLVQHVSRWLTRTTTLKVSRKWWHHSPLVHRYLLDTELRFHRNAFKWGREKCRDCYSPIKWITVNICVFSPWYFPILKQINKALMKKRWISLKCIISFGRLISCAYWRGSTCWLCCYNPHAHTHMYLQFSSF